MLTMREASVDYERGYVAGVDDYLSKRVPDAELFARITAAFNTLALRRSLKEAQAALEQAAAIDAESGAFALRELFTRLHGEIMRAQRYGRKLTLLTLERVGGRARDCGRGDAVAGELRGIVQHDRKRHSLADRLDCRLDSERGAAFAVVAAESSISEHLDQGAYAGRAAQLRGKASRRCSSRLRSVSPPSETRASRARLSIRQRWMEIGGLCRNCPGRTGPEQLGADQRSVACHVSIVGRHGYVVYDECSLKSRLSARRADEEEALAG
jgi:hypothetical protein